MARSDRPDTPPLATTERRIFLHGCCASWGEQGVLLTGAPGSGKSDLLLRLVDAGFNLVADDRVELRIDAQGAWASPAPNLAGFIEVRGLGIVRMPSRPHAALALCVELGDFPHAPRLPPALRHAETGLWLLRLDARRAGAIAVIRTALRCLNGEYGLFAGLNGADGTILPFPYDIENG